MRYDNLFGNEVKVLLGVVKVGNLERELVSDLFLFFSFSQEIETKFDLIFVYYFGISILIFFK